MKSIELPYDLPKILWINHPTFGHAKAQHPAGISHNKAKVV
jgi:hypothetical protein